VFFSFKFHFRFSFSFTLTFSFALSFWFWFCFRFSFSYSFGGIFVLFLTFFCMLDTDLGITSAGTYIINQLMPTY